MKTNDLGERMRRLEVFHGLRVPLGAWTIIRVDGCGFSRLTADEFAKPFDPRFSDAMVTAAQSLLKRFQGVYAYTESDEISLLLPRDANVFDREVEKLVSITAGLASAAFSLRVAIAAAFDSRVVVAARTQETIDYFRWRQSDAARCGLNGWCYWTLRQHGASQAAATRQLHGLSRSAKHDLLFDHGINFATLPGWQRHGIGLHWENYHKQAIDPRSQRPVLARRRRLVVDRDLPVKDAYEKWLREQIIGLRALA